MNHLFLAVFENVNCDCSEYIDIEDEEFDKGLIDHDREDTAADNHEDSDESDDDEDGEDDTEYHTAVDKTSDPRPGGRWIRKGKFSRRARRFTRARRPRPRSRRFRRVRRG